MARINDEQYSDPFSKSKLNPMGKIVEVPKHLDKRIRRSIDLVKWMGEFAEMFFGGHADLLRNKDKNLSSEE